jgi:DNA-binding response OmpR family regulator
MQLVLSCPAAFEATSWVLGSAPRAAGPDVLLVEDDRDIAEMYRRRLAADGLRVIVVGDSGSALRELDGSVPGVVLLDIRLPDEDGFHVLQAMRSDPALARVPVLMLSNYGEPATVRRALELGASEYMVKSSVTPTQVSLRVRAHLGGGGALQ